MEFIGENYKAKPKNVAQDSLGFLWFFRLLLAMPLFLSACSPHPIDPLQNTLESRIHENFPGSESVISVEGEEIIDDLPLPADVSTGVVEEEVEFVADWDGQKRGSFWTKVTLTALRSLGIGMVLESALPDAHEYCPRYKALNFQERLQFYLMLISSMARYESRFRPELSYTEKFKDGQGEYVVSRGLMQMSIESANGYGCGIDSAQELHDSETNLKCAVRVLNRWVTKDKRLSTYGKSPNTGEMTNLGGNRYWAVLRKTSDARKKIQEKTRGLEFCQN